MTSTVRIPPEKIYTSLDPVPLAGVVRIALLVDLAASALVALEYAVVLRMGIDTETSEHPIALVVTFAQIASVVVYYSVGFLILKWIYRVSRNAHSMAKGLEVSPVMSVGSFFIPFLNLIVPFSGVRQAWQVSTQRSGWRHVPVPGLLRLWWALWLIRSAISAVVFQSVLRGNPLDLNLDLLSFLEMGIQVPLDLVFLQIVAQLTQLQSHALSEAAFE